MLTVVFCLLAAACTGGDDEPSVSPSSASCEPSECPVSSDRGDIVYQPGRYKYSFNEVSATFAMDGSAGSLEVENGSGAEIGNPGMYVVSGDGKRFAGTVDSPAPIADGGSGTFTVTFPKQVKPGTVGLVVLLFGGSNYGAMEPVPEA